MAKKHQKRKASKILKWIARILFFIILNIVLIILFLTFYINDSFSNISFEQLLYSAQTSEGTGENVIINGASYVLIRLLITDIILFALVFLIRKLFKKDVFMEISIRSKKFKLNLLPLSWIFKVIILVLFSLYCLYYSAYNIGLIDYVFNSKDSHFFDKNYVLPSDDKVTSTDNTNNLILIYVESLESSFFSEENGGNFEESVIPSLEKIASDNINFSSTTTLGGSSMASGASWTVAGLVASSAGIPLKFTSENENLTNGFNGSYLPGAYTLGEVLEEKGYNNYFMLGSNSYFGGRYYYFSQHGNYEIYDYAYAKEAGWIDEDYYAWWGYEDRKLYKFAKDKLTEIAESDEPFNFTMLTADTHFYDGYVDGECEIKYDEHYLNSYSCTDDMLSEFISWIQDQDFYENTTIVILGDHLSMQSNLTDMFDVEGDRYIYNAFINSKVKTKNANNRSFTAMDMYPTILASLGFEIKGNRLGLGTNLFSDRKTLPEQIGIDEFNDEISNKSLYYNNNIVKDDDLVG